MRGTGRAAFAAIGNFFLCVYVVHGIVSFGEAEHAPAT